MTDAWKLDFTNVNDEAEVYVNGVRVQWIANQWDDTRLVGHPDRLAALKARATLGLYLGKHTDTNGTAVPNPTIDLAGASGWKPAGTNVVVVRVTDTAGRGGSLAAQVMKNGEKAGDAITTNVAQRTTVVSGWVITISAEGTVVVENGIAAVGNDVGKSIPGTGTEGTVTFSAAVTETATVADVRIWLSLTHTYVDDLQISLKSPAGTTVKLYDREAPGHRYEDGAAFSGVLFDSAATKQLVEGDVPPYTGELRPDGDLGLFKNEAANGDWQLVIADLAGQDQGVMGEWGIFIGS